MATSLCLIEVSVQGLQENELLEVLGNGEHLLMPQIDAFKAADTGKGKYEDL